MRPINEIFSEKQIESIRDSNRRFNVWVGAVRSGKTFSSIYRFIRFLRKGPPGSVMIIGVNRDTIQRNVLNELYNFLGFPLPGTKSTETKLYGRHVYFVGAHDESAVRRIQGSTLAAAYVDEATCIPQPFWRMLLSRLSVPGAQLFATCNPEGPAHWLKKEYLDNPAIDLVSWHFTLDDNPSLDDSYKENLKKEYSGMWYNRYILGQWAMATGAVYDRFDDDNIYSKDYPNPDYYIAGIDYGTVNPTCCLLAAVMPHRWPQIRIIDEYYYDSSKTGRQKTDAEYADDIKEFLYPRSVEAIYIDPAAASLKIELRNADLPVLDAVNDVIPGIQIMHKFIAGKNLLVHEKCKNLIEEIYSYQWDPKSVDRGEDKPIKQADHGVDSARYLLASAFPDGELSTPDENISIEMRRRKIYGENEIIFTGMGAGGYY